MKRKVDVIIVGCGMAGLGAAEVLAGSGLRVLMVDDNAHGGGQLLRTPHNAGLKSPSSRAPWFDPVKQMGFRGLDRIKGKPIERLQGLQVLGLFPGPSLVVEAGPGNVQEIQGTSVLLATGARERFLPFKGWTLPGVISTGGAQILMKSHGILPGPETLVGGTGPLQLALASEILRHHGRVAAVLDLQCWQSKLGIFPLVHHQLPRMVEGAMHLYRILAGRVPLKQGVAILEARGKQALESVVAARLDSRGTPVPRTRTVYKADTLAVGYGFVANLELAVQAGCRTVYDPDRGGWTVRVDSSLETSIPSVFAAGEITGIAGGRKSWVEGIMAARSILETLGQTGNAGPLGSSFGHKTPGCLERVRQREMAYGRFLNRLCHIPAAAFRAIDDDTIICRCEEITMKEIRRAMALGFLTPGSIKKETRCSMGRCQGRICGPVIGDILSAFSGQPPGSMGPVPARFPVKNVSLDALAALDIGPALPGPDSGQVQGPTGGSGR
ncbi:MAG: NAD(P)/FAD-dependent oxidoreductase [Pseudomonadota bacterium]